MRSTLYQKNRRLIPEMKRILRKDKSLGGVRDAFSEVCDLGEPLTDRVGVFIGITGANYGSYYLSTTCDMKG